MHEEFDDKFDLFVRSMMEDAGEEIPSGMWDAIESRLPQKSPAIVWWKRLGFVVAACAVIASAFLITGTFDKAGDINIVPQSERATVAQSVTRPSAPDNRQEISEGLTEILQQSSGITVTDPVSSSVAAENIMTPVEYMAPSETENPTSQETAVPVPHDTKNTTGVSESPAGKSDDDAGKRTYEKEWNSLLAQDQEKLHTHKKVSADFRGSFGSNDNISNGSQGPEWRAAPTILGNAESGIIESGESFYSIPVTFGIGARYYFTDRFSAGIGINYSILTRSFSGTYQETAGGFVTERIPNADITHKMSYLGIPVNLYLDILQTDLLRFYTFAGGAAEKCLSNKYKVRGDAGEASISESVKGLQWSAAFGLGIQFNLSEHIGLYLDPNARYYFDCKQPKNIRTQKPFMFNIEAGIRFNL